MVVLLSTWKVIDFAMVCDWAENVAFSDASDKVKELLPIDVTFPDTERVAVVCECVAGLLFCACDGNAQSIQATARPASADTPIRQYFFIAEASSGSSAGTKLHAQASP